VTPCTRPCGWAAFRELRQRPAPIIRRRHANFRHGRFCKRGIEDRRLLRACVAVLRGRVQEAPCFPLRSVPPGWQAYRARLTE